MKDLIAKVADGLCCGKPDELIHQGLIAEGLTENQAYLTYQAGKLLADAREKEVSERPTVKCRVAPDINTKTKGST